VREWGPAPCPWMGSGVPVAVHCYVSELLPTDWSCFAGASDSRFGLSGQGLPVRRSASLHARAARTWYHP